MTKEQAKLYSPPKGIDVKNFEVLSEEVSDHTPILLEFELVNE